MFEKAFYKRLSFRLTLVLMLSALLGIILVALLAYNSTSGNFDRFIQNMMGMGYMGGGGMMNNIVAMAEADFYHNLNRSLWLAGLVGMGLAAGLGIIFTRQITRPLVDLTRAAGSIRRGNLDERVEPGGSGEIAELATSINSLAAKLKQDQEMRHNMLADIAHELRTPLSILQGNIEAILDGALPPDEQNLSSLHQETQHLSRLVEDLRTLSLAESGRLHFDITDIDLGRLAEEVVGGFRPQLETKNIEVDLQILDGVPHVAGDRDRVIQILRNLIANACKYTPEDGRIALKIEASESMVTASVADTGPGIPEEDIERVFDRFYRLDASRTRRTGGTGLGLAIVKQLTESMGGRVWARSVYGKVSTFSFSLPRAGTPSSTRL